MKTKCLLHRSALPPQSEEHTDSDREEPAAAADTAPEANPASTIVEENVVSNATAL